ncbi:MAG: desulfoferrodoxin family protein [Eubacteriales bacterium]|jgi:superoxide reductase|nr:desulfoferrodoxin family protein [Eubacteriales bacterium]MDD3571609.1 desulfoferrodoxin family protein [Eubacteriales bacterium]MDD4134205.1 desulfoferrodoxin family protein [Eubacteriales bacterium]NLO13414.1 desulfoferrodoxin [Clostridiales bacterium]
MKFYYCSHCGNVVMYLFSSGVPVICCGEEMKLLDAGTVDASREKHVPVLEIQHSVVTVKVGSVPHPMEEKHHIPFIVLETTAGYQVRHLKPGQAPQATFALGQDERVVAAYEYCNLHGLWKAEA